MLLNTCNLVSSLLFLFPSIFYVILCIGHSTVLCNAFYNCFCTACPGEFSCYPPSSPQHKCISLGDVCNGVIDCSENYADEIHCESGCFYDDNHDPFYLYYRRLNESGIAIPAIIQSTYMNRMTSMNDPQKSWRRESTSTIKTIRFNRVVGGRARSCRWTVSPPQVYFVANYELNIHSVCAQTKKCTACSVGGAAPSVDEPPVFNR